MRARLKREAEERRRIDQERRERARQKSVTSFKLVCRDCKYCLTFEERSLKQCPHCGSSNIGRFFGSRGGSSVDNIGKAVWGCYLLFIIIGILITIFLVAI